MMTEKRKAKGAVQNVTHVSLKLEPGYASKLNKLVDTDKSDRNKTLRKIIDYAFDNPQDALRPRI